MIGPKISHHPFNQSNAKLKTIVPCPIRIFPRSLGGPKANRVFDDWIPGTYLNTNNPKSFHSLSQTEPGITEIAWLKL